MNAIFSTLRKALPAVVALAYSPMCFSAQSSQKPNVMLIVLDQLQADRLHCYRNPRGTSPNIDRLAQEGVLFSEFYSVAPWTSPSYATLMTSLYPSRHGATLFWRAGTPLISEKVPMLAEIFKAHGYRTMAIVNNGLAGKDLTGRGFEEYFERQRNVEAVNITQRRGDPNAVITAPATVERLLPWLDQHQHEPFFVWLLFYEPHSPYNPPPDHDIFKSEAYPNQFNTGYDIESGYLLRLAMMGDPKAIERLYQLYDGKIHFVDSYVGQVLDHLRKLGLDKNTYVILTSDHGELMYTHPRDFLTFDHRSLYNAVMHIPFIVAGPNVPQARRVDALASNLDSAPTILDLAGLPPLSDAQGHSLVPVIQGKTDSLNQYLFGEEDVVIPLRSARDSRFKLIFNLWSGKKEVFDLARDPDEQYDIAGHRPDVTNALFARLQEWMKENQPNRAEQLERWKILTKPQKVETVDDQTHGGGMLISGGGWHSDESRESGHYEGSCLWTEAGDGSRKAVWRPENPMIGTYRVYVYYGHPSLGLLASEAPFTVVTERDSKTMHVDFNRGAGQWNLLGTFENPRYVQVTNAANGAIIADAIKFERLE